MRRFVSPLVFSLCILLSVISSCLLFTVDASAALSDGRYLTPQESRDIFGSTISGKYYNGTEYVDCTFTYNTTATKWAVNTSGLKGDYLNANSTYLIYTANFIASTNVQYITVEVHPTYSIFDTTQIHSCIALSAGTSNASSPVTPSSTFQSPSWDWIIGGSSVHLENSDTVTGGGKKAGIDFKLNDVHTWFSFVQLDFTSQSSISGYSLAADFYGNSAISGKYYLAIGCPYVDSSSTASNGTFTTAASGSGGDINVNVDVDMDETNGLLGDIKGILQGIVTGIQNLFVPSEESITDFKDDMEDLLSDHLGGIYEAIDIISGIWTRFESVVAKSSIDIPACNIPLAGETLTLGPYTVPLKPEGMPRVLYDALAWIIDFLAVASFLRMCRNKLEIFLNPDSEVVQDDS